MLIEYVHSYLRWIILILFIVVIYRHFLGMQKNRPFQKMDYNLSLFLTISVDIMLLIGIILYFISSMGYKAFENYPDLVMTDSYIRGRAVEHPILMIIAIVLTHIGAAQRKKLIDDQKKHKKMFWFYLIALIIILIGIPAWGFKGWY